MVPVKLHCTGCVMINGNVKICVGRDAQTYKILVYPTWTELRRDPISMPCQPVPYIQQMVDGSLLHACIISFTIRSAENNNAVKIRPKRNRQFFVGYYFYARWRSSLFVVDAQADAILEIVVEDDFDRSPGKAVRHT